MLGSCCACAKIAPAHTAMTSTMRSTCRAEHEQEANAGALAFKRTGDLNTGSFDDATILRTFGVIPQNLDEL
jgi:hypothetical protein